MSLPTPLLSLAAFAVVLGTSTSWSADAQRNTTGLPTYPRDGDGVMDATFRSLPNGQHCSHYSSNTTDALAAVEDWYKKALPAAKLDDINHNSMYGGYFKLEGIKLLSGNDIVNIYKLKNDEKTSIELFKCRDAASAKE